MASRLRVFLLVTDMNTEPFERAIPAVVLIEKFYRNLLKVCQRSLLPAAAIVQ